MFLRLLKASSLSPGKTNELSGKDEKTKKKPWAKTKNEEENVLSNKKIFISKNVVTENHPFWAKKEIKKNFNSLFFFFSWTPKIIAANYCSVVKLITYWNYLLFYYCCSENLLFWKNTERAWFSPKKIKKENNNFFLKSKEKDEFRSFIQLIWKNRKKTKKDLV